MVLQSPQNSTSSRTVSKLVATAALSALLLSGCSETPLPTVGPSPHVSPAVAAPIASAIESEVTVHVLYVRGDTGGQGERTISVQPSSDGRFTIDIAEDEVSGTGDMMRASSWNSVMVATLLSGAPLGNHYRFESSGWVDGPSAGALSTVGLLSLQYGDELLDGVTMTGTINPTGTVGVVGGIPEKIQGAIDSKKFTKILIPAGQRNVPNLAGEQIDVVTLGSRAGLEVVEVGDIFESYRHMTGKDLPVPIASDPKVDDRGYSKLKSATDTELAAYNRVLGDFAVLEPYVQEAGWALYEDAAATAARASNLQKQGLQGGAFSEAVTAHMIMRATVSGYNTMQVTLQQGPQAFISRLATMESTSEHFVAFLDQLGLYQPKTLTDVEALVTTYASVFDALSLLQYAQDALDTVLLNWEGGVYGSVEELLEDGLLPLLFSEIASAQIDASKSVFEIGRDNNGGVISDSVDLKAIGDFFRRGADANWAAFESVHVQPNAVSYGVSNDVYRSYLMDADVGVALAYTAQSGVRIIQNYIGEDAPNAAYAAMGYGYSNYARNAINLEKYANNGILDENFEVVGVRSEAILSRALDLGRTQVSRSVSVLDANGTMPALIVGSFEKAGVSRERGLVEKFQAIEDYSAGYLLSRILSYVGDFPTQGYER